MSGYRQSPDSELHHTLGGAVDPFYPAINPSKVWLDYLPDPIQQNKNGFEPETCVDHTLTAQTYAVMKQMGFNPDQYSVRALAIISNTDPDNGGTDPATAYDRIRHYGVISENLLPYDDSIKDIKTFFSPEPLSFTLQAKGSMWADTFTLSYKWLWLGRCPDNWRELLNQGLACSPVAISVDAWTQDSNGVYIRIRPTDDHMTLYVADMHVRDSYKPFSKQISEGMRPSEACIIKIEKVSSKIDPLFSVKQWLIRLFQAVLSLGARNVIMKSA